ncbi:MAG: hypothetical protein NTW87_04245 [Planctomycetota bacterium]|nr:hypothetical protein [Planctomycetota bacterium]
MIDSVQECVLSAHLFLATVEEARKATGSTFMEAGAEPEPRRRRSDAGNGHHARLLAQVGLRETVLPEEIATITDKVLLGAGDEPDSSVWRGVFVVDVPREVFFTKRVDLKTAELPELEPRVVIGLRMLEMDDE